MALSRGSKVFLIVLVVIGGAVAAGLMYVSGQLAGVDGPSEPVAVDVSQGATAGGIGDVLVGEGIVKNSLAFRLVARSRGLDSKLQAGTYDLETGMSVDEAIDALLGGPRERGTVVFTVREGLSFVLTLEALAEQTPYSVEEYQTVLDARRDAGANGEGVLTLPDWVPELTSFGPDVRYPYEGLLFPETYQVFEEASAQQILQRMIDQLVETAAQVPVEDIARAVENGVDRYQALIIASLIERETRANDERPTVSGVIYNRLEAGQQLQIDATVLYARGEWKQLVLTADTEIDSVYNTYKVQGLPPTPISGAGASSLLAAFAPDDNPFFYYVVKAPECDGTHQFAETLEDHNRNVAAYRDAGRCGVS